MVSSFTFNRKPKRPNIITFDDMVAPWLLQQAQWRLEDEKKSSSTSSSPSVSSSQPGPKIFSKLGLIKIKHAATRLLRRKGKADVSTSSSTSPNDTTVPIPPVQGMHTTALPSADKVSVSCAQVTSVHGSTLPGHPASSHTPTPESMTSATDRCSDAAPHSVTPVFVSEPAVIDIESGLQAFMDDINDSHSPQNGTGPKPSTVLTLSSATASTAVGAHLAPIATGGSVINFMADAQVSGAATDSIGSWTWRYSREGARSLSDLTRSEHLVLDNRSYREPTEYGFFDGKGDLAMPDNDALPEEYSTSAVESQPAMLDEDLLARSSRARKSSGTLSLSDNVAQTPELGHSTGDDTSDDAFFYAAAVSTDKRDQTFEDLWSGNDGCDSDAEFRYIGSVHDNDNDCSDSGTEFCYIGSVDDQDNDGSHSDTEFRYVGMDDPAVETQQDLGAGDLVDSGHTTPSRTQPQATPEHLQRPEINWATHKSRRRRRRNKRPHGDAVEPSDAAGPSNAAEPSNTAGPSGSAVKKPRPKWLFHGPRGKRGGVKKRYGAHPPDPDSEPDASLP